jgi:MarR family transcriptional regulator, lower aerobic nicotinate degradation pathway regulator
VASLPVLNQPVPQSAALLDLLARRMRLRVESALMPLGLRPRHFVALTVLRDGQRCSQQELASTLQMDGTNIVGLLNELEADGLIVRRRSPQDRRRHVVEVTDAGAQRLAKAEFALAAAEDDVLRALDRGQRETLHDLLQQATGNTAADCAEAIGD